MPPMPELERHRCDERCVCPDHHTQLWWGASQSLHACQDPDCRYAHGLENHSDYVPEWMTAERRPRGEALLKLLEDQLVLPDVFMGRPPPWLTDEPSTNG